MVHGQGFVEQGMPLACIPSFACEECMWQKSAPMLPLADKVHY